MCRCQQPVLRHAAPDAAPAVCPWQSANTRLGTDPGIPPSLRPAPPAELRPCHACLFMGPQSLAPACAAIRQQAAALRALPEGEGVAAAVAAPPGGPGTCRSAGSPQDSACSTQEHLACTDSRPAKRRCA